MLYSRGKANGKDECIARNQTARHSLGLVWLVLLLLALGCAVSDWLPRPTPTTELPRVLVPTFTATPATMAAVVIITPPHDGTPGVIIIPPGMDPNKVIPSPPTATPVPAPTLPGGTPGPQPPPAGQPTFTPVPTVTPLPTPTASLTPTPTPFVEVENAVVSLRSGPGVEYPLIAQLGANLPVPLVGRTPDGAWYQICCINNTSLWVAANDVRVHNDPSSIALMLGTASPPAPTPTTPPTPTGTVTPTPTATRLPFERARGPEFFPSCNQFLTIWAKFYVGAPGGPDDQEAPAAGYALNVKFQANTTYQTTEPAFERKNTGTEQPSADQFFYSGNIGATNRVKYNYKYEYHPPEPTVSFDATPTARPDCPDAPLIGTGTWIVTVVDGAGHPLADPIYFTTSPSNLNREVYIAWIRTR